MLGSIYTVRLHSLSQKNVHLILVTGMCEVKSLNLELFTFFERALYCFKFASLDTKH